MDSPVEDRRDRAMARARTELAASYGHMVDSVFSYGAVTIDPVHLVVWVLLKGDPESIPEWFFPAHEPHADEAGSIMAAIHEMRNVVVGCFAEEAWPNAKNLDVGFDSATRVAEGGGWYYFK
ncbi:hypothetical protein Pth03_28590 [Planotetraspora thailandica]|uniref:Uncharacterized protein n=1 Tax=Planotetraspora thailandica TaxID=487172 RepID=A0A8J3XVY5_9ACTN|nr:hypothetical protein [Planotetraspora thailandica]GII54470.1 hypothetical protein Pth03_28590 [Planotetraspora thailandica]